MTTPQPLMLDTLLQAAQLWAQVGAVVITENVGHLSLMVSVRCWQDDVEL